MLSTNKDRLKHQEFDVITQLLFSYILFLKYSWTNFQVQKQEMPVIIISTQAAQKQIATAEWDPSSSTFIPFHVLVVLDILCFLFDVQICRSYMMMTNALKKKKNLTTLWEDLATKIAAVS